MRHRLGNDQSSAKGRKNPVAPGKMAPVHTRTERIFGKNQMIRCHDPVQIPVFPGIFPGQSAADLSRTREKWLQKMADSLIRQAGCSAASDKMKERTVSFLSMVYSKAQYSCSPGSGTDKILVEYSPMTIFQDSAEDLKEYNSSFAAGNKAGKYKKLSSQQYADSCLDGMLTILESRLGSLSYGKAVQEEITVSEDDENRRTLDPAQLEKVMEGMLPLS